MNLLVILGLDVGTTSTVYIFMSIMHFSNALPDPLPVLAHAIAGYSNRNSVDKYCEKYVKPENVVGAEEVKSSDEKLSEDEYAASDDEEIAEKIDL